MIQHINFYHRTCTFTLPCSISFHYHSAFPLPGTFWYNPFITIVHFHYLVHFGTAHLLPSYVFITWNILVQHIHYPHTFLLPEIFSKTHSLQLHTPITWNTFITTLYTHETEALLFAHHEDFKTVLDI